MQGLPWQAMIGPLIPIFGKFLLALPFIPNKLIPFINAVVNTILKYTLLLGWNIDANTTAMLHGDMHLAGFGFFGSFAKILLPPVWGIAESALASKFYDGQKAIAKIEQKECWWSKHKNSWFS